MGNIPKLPKTKLSHPEVDEIILIHLRYNTACKTSFINCYKWQIMKPVSHAVLFIHPSKLYGVQTWEIINAERSHERIVNISLILPDRRMLWSEAIKVLEWLTIQPRFYDLNTSPELGRKEFSGNSKMPSTARFQGSRGSIVLF